MTERCRDWDALEHSVLKGISSSDLSPEGSGNYDEEEAERLKASGDGRFQGNNAFQTQEYWCTDELTETGTTCTSQNQMEISALRRESGHYLLTLTQKLPPTDNYSLRKKSFSPIESHWLYTLHFSASSWQQQTHPSQKKLNGGFWRFFVLLMPCLGMLYLIGLLLVFYGLWFCVFWGFYVCVWVHVSVHGIYVFCTFYYFICLVVL